MLKKQKKHQKQPAASHGSLRAGFEQLQDRALGVWPQEREKLPTFHSGYEATAFPRTAFVEVDTANTGGGVGKKATLLYLNEVRRSHN